MTRLALTLVAIVAIVAFAASAATTATAQDFGNVKSGLLLGIYTGPSQGGMRVNGLIPGYSAEQVLGQGDVLLRVAVSENEVYRLRSRFELENAKMAIGADRQAAVEIWRPQVGLIYAFVEFTPIYGPAAAAMAAPSGSKAATFKLDHSGHARGMFKKQPSGQVGPPNQGGFPNPGQPQPPRQPNHNTNDASRFFK